MSFPTLVFKKGGAHQMKGGTFSYRGIDDEEALEAALADGWVASMVELEAVSGEVKPVVVAAKVEEVKEEKVDEVSPPTREELVAKATELGIKFSKNLGDKKLAALIEAKLAE